MTSRNEPHKLREPVITWVVHFGSSGEAEPAITWVVHFGASGGAEADNAKHFELLRPLGLVVENPLV